MKTLFITVLIALIAGAGLEFFSVMYFTFAILSVLLVNADITGLGAELLRLSRRYRFLWPALDREHDLALALGGRSIAA